MFPLSIYDKEYYILNCFCFFIQQAFIYEPTPASDRFRVTCAQTGFRQMARCASIVERTPARSPMNALW